MKKTCDHCGGEGFLAHKCPVADCYGGGEREDKTLCPKCYGLGFVDVSPEEAAYEVFRCLAKLIIANKEETDPKYLIWTVKISDELVKDWEAMKPYKDLTENEREKRDEWVGDIFRHSSDIS